MKGEETITFENPLEDFVGQLRLPDPCLLIIFGATGDLMARKLLPALYHLAREGQLPTEFACVGVARKPKEIGQFREEMRQALAAFSRVQPIDSKEWESFSERLFYHRSYFDEDAGYQTLHSLLKELDQRFGTRGNRLYYLATPPSYFTHIVEKLSSYRLIHSPEKKAWSRVIIEKPFGQDLSSAKELQNRLSQHLDESQIWRIDHWLGKETVQNLFAFRFGNPIFEAVWNCSQIDQIQITVAEEIGVAGRGDTFEESGLIRDIVQNHMMQLLALVAMEPPERLTAKAIRKEKIELLREVQPFKLDHSIVRGQYATGFIEGKQVVGYLQEEGVAKDSRVETYSAMELFIDNPRWMHVPFYLRAGKRLPKRATEISITFKNKQNLFGNNLSNVLVIRIQPDEGIALNIQGKVPGLQNLIQPVKMNFHYNSYFGSSSPEAYERLLCDCMAGDSTLFAHIDEVLASWELFSPVLKKWQEEGAPPPQYAAGSWGPQVADQLPGRSSRRWRLL